MKYPAQLQILGMKASKGTLENGTAYDSTKVYAVVDMDTSKGNAYGQSSAEFTLGTSDEIDKFKNLTFPFMGHAEMEVVTNGKATKVVMNSLRPLEAPKTKPQ